MISVSGSAIQQIINNQVQTNSLIFNLLLALGFLTGAIVIHFLFDRFR